MKIKLSEIINGEKNIASLQEVKLPVKISYRIKRLVDKLIPILKNYQEEKNKLVIEFGEKLEEDKYEVTDPIKLKEFWAKVTELQEIEEEIDFEKIKVEELGNINI